MANHVRSPSPAWSLSLLEVRELVHRYDRQIEELGRIDLGEGKYTRERGFYSDTFLKDCERVKGSIRLEEKIKDPQVFVFQDQGRWSMAYNMRLYSKTLEEISLLKARSNDVNVGFVADSLRISIDWAKGVQIDIATLMFHMQQKYIFGSNPLFKKPVSGRFVANYIGIERPSLARAKNDLVMHVYGNNFEKAIFVSELIPGPRPTEEQLPEILMELRKNTRIYSNDAWRVPSTVLAEKIANKYGVIYARRTISKYMAQTSRKNIRNQSISPAEVVRKMALNPDVFYEGKWKMHVQDVTNLANGIFDIKYHARTISKYMSKIATEGMRGASKMKRN